MRRRLAVCTLALGIILCLAVPLGAALPAPEGPTDPAWTPHSLIEAASPPSPPLARSGPETTNVSSMDHALGISSSRMSPLARSVSSTTDVAISVAYYSIPTALFYFVRQARTHLPLESVVMLFVAFISLCGTTHLVAAGLAFYPSSVVLWTWILTKFITAAVSLYTAYVLMLLLPKAVQIPRFIQAMESELAKKHLSEKSLRYQNDALVLLRQVVLKIRKKLTRAAILKTASKEIGRALFKRDLFSRPTENSEETFRSTPQTPDTSETALDATSRLLGEFIEQQEEEGQIGSEDSPGTPESRVYGGRCLVYVPSTFQESKLTLVSEYATRSVGRTAAPDLDTRNKEVAETLGISKCIVLFSSRDSEVIHDIFCTTQISDGPGRRNSRASIGSRDSMDEIAAVLMVRFPLPKSSFAEDGASLILTENSTPNNSPGAESITTHNVSLTSGDMGTSGTSELEADTMGSDWGIVVLHIQDPGIDRDELQERIEFAASLLTDAAEQIGIALNQGGFLELQQELRDEKLTCLFHDVLSKLD